MQYLPLLQPIQQPKAQAKPHLDSLDSGYEFSLDHLLEIVTLVERQEFDLEKYVFDDSCLFVSQ